VRWDVARLRRRLLSGGWRADLDARVQEHFGPTRRAVMGRVSMARNPFRRLCTELAVNYDRPPMVRHPAGPVPLLLDPGGVLDAMGLWPLMQSVQSDLIGLREMWMRLDWSAELGRPVVRAVTPDCIEATPHPADPNVPVEVRELRWIHVPTLGYRWVWEILSIADPAAPSWRFIEAAPTAPSDYTALVLGPAAGSYPWRWTEGDRAGTPFLPGVLYHARMRGRLFDPTEGEEVVEGTLDTGASYTFLGHVIYRASWPRNIAVGLVPVGSVPREGPDGQARAEVVSDPVAVNHFEHIEPGTPGTFTQLQPTDPEALARTVAMVERSVADFDGLGLSAAQLIQSSSNPWSAAALTISRDDKRRAQQKYTPSLRVADLGLIERIAAITNGAAGMTAIPEQGYRIDYASVPLARDEAEAMRAHHGELIAAGRMSTVDAYLIEHPGSTEEEARAALRRIAADNAEFRVTAGTTPAPVVTLPASAP
jgi:hypothetical protein